MTAHRGAGGAPDRNTSKQLYERLFAGIGTRTPGRRESGSGTGGTGRVLALIWATIDRDRVLADLGTASELLAGDPHLGASVGLVRPAEGDPIAIVEPATEGRLAVILARHGEGLAGAYVEAPVPLGAIAAAAAAAGLVVSRPADGPFGRSVLVASGRAGRSVLVLVERPAGTIGR